MLLNVYEWSRKWCCEFYEKKYMNDAFIHYFKVNRKVNLMIISINIYNIIMYNHVLCNTLSNRILLKNKMDTETQKQTK